MSWHNDPAHAHITVTVRHMMISNVWGVSRSLTVSWNSTSNT